MSIEKIDHDLCNGCGICIKSCPYKILLIYFLGHQHNLEILLLPSLGFKTPSLGAICHSGGSRNPESKLDAGSGPA